MLQDGWQMTGDSTQIVLNKQGLCIKFDIVVPTTTGRLYCLQFMGHKQETTHIGIKHSDNRVPLDDLHAKMGHMNNTTVKKVASVLQLDLTTREMPTCEACARAKAQQKTFSKVEDDTPQCTLELGERRIYLDIAQLMRPSGANVLSKSYWRIMVDETTQLKFTDFFNTKDGMVNPTCAQFSQWKAQGFVVRYLRMDNAGENTLLASVMNGADWQLNITPEYTARNSPQQNHLAEIGIATLMNRARAMLIASGVPSIVRYKLARKAIETATLLDGLTPITLGNTTATRYEHAFGATPAFAQHLRVWGEAGVVTIKSKIHAKLQDKGITCIFVGYAKNHAGAVYEMWNPSTSAVHITRDVTWLNRMFYQSLISPTTGACIQQAGESDKVCGRNEQAEQVSDDGKDDDIQDEDVTIEIRNSNASEKEQARVPVEVPETPKTVTFQNQQEVTNSPNAITMDR